MNREMQSKLVAALRDAMDAQGINQSDIARHIGTSSGMVSQAFSCKGQMCEERWRMCCELCGVDFDRFMESQQSRAEQTEPVHDEEEVHPMAPNERITLTTTQCRRLAEFINNHLCDEIKTNPFADFEYIEDMMEAHASFVKLWLHFDELPHEIAITINELEEE